MQKKNRLLHLEFKLLSFFQKIDDVLSKETSGKILCNVLVSGGKDSICLLHALSTLFYSKKAKLKSKFVLIVTHFNHKKRAQESDDDAFFVLNTSLKLGVEYFSFDIARTETQNNFQNFARSERYRLSTQLCETLCAHDRYDKFFILTAHHALDHVESVILHLVRGSGITGLQGFYGTQMPHVLKPFAETSTHEIQKYIEEKHIHFRTDSSNLTDDYDRNFVRHHIVPQLAKLNTHFDKNILKFSHTLTDINDKIKIPATPHGDFIFLPSTTTTEVYTYLKRHFPKMQNSQISQNSIKNILYEVDIFRHSSNFSTKIIPLKHRKTLTLYKKQNNSDQVFASI